MHTPGTWISRPTLISHTCWNQATRGLFFLTFATTFEDMPMRSPSRSLLGTGGLLVAGLSLLVTSGVAPRAVSGSDLVVPHTDGHPGWLPLSTRIGILPIAR